MCKLIEKGTYLAQQGETGVLVAIDEYMIEKEQNGYKIRSDNVIFGSNGFQQSAEIFVDNKWMMTYLHIEIDSQNIELTANIENGNAMITQRQRQKKIEKVIPLQLKQYFFIYSGGLIIPMIWLRGFDFLTFNKIQYQLLPIGVAEVMQIKQNKISDVLHFSLTMQIGEITDYINIKTNQEGKVLLYESAISKLIIKPQL
jgi:hypothetical protein